MARQRLFVCEILAILAVCRITAADETVLYEGVSAFNEIFVTEDAQGLRILQFEKNGARQSVVKPGDPDHLELAYAHAMPVGFAIVERPRRILIVGLGGGTIPTFLHRHYPDIAIDVVEIDPLVVQVAKKYFGFVEDRTLRSYVDDGRNFIEQCREPYDMILLDAFDSENVPYRLATREFLQATRRAVSLDGVVIANIWGRYSNPLYDSMVRTYQDVFDELGILKVRGVGNEILIALPRKRQIEHGALAERATQISREKQFGFDMGDFVAHGYRRMKQKNVKGHVLTDKK